MGVWRLFTIIADIKNSDGLCAIGDTPDEEPHLGKRYLSVACDKIDVKSLRYRFKQLGDGRVLHPYLSVDGVERREHRPDMQIARSLDPAHQKMLGVIVSAGRQQPYSRMQKSTSGKNAIVQQAEIASRMTGLDEIVKILRSVSVHNAVRLEAPPTGNRKVVEPANIKALIPVVLLPQTLCP